MVFEDDEIPDDIERDIFIQQLRYSAYFNSPLILGAIAYFVFKIASIATRFDTHMLAITLDIGFAWVLTNVLAAIPTLIVDRYFNNRYLFVFVKDIFPVPDWIISFANFFFS